MFGCLGTYLAKAIIDQQTTGLRLNVALLALLIGRPCTAALIAEAFPAHSRGMDWVRDNEIDGTCPYNATFCFN
jgi:multisubunit Na+/H+ antiporter MnhG subunit